MAGILDSFGSFVDSPGGMGLLSAIAAGMAGARKGAPINSVGAGLLGGLQGYGQAQQDQRQAALEAQRGKLMDAQLQNFQAEADARKAGIAKQQQIDAALRSAFAPVSPIEANAVSGITGPRPEALSVVGQQKPINYQALIGQGVPEATVKALAESSNYGKPKVARTIEGADAQGNKVTRQYDEFGNEVGQGVSGYVAPVQVDLGGKVMFVKPQGGVTLGKTMTPGEQASNAVAWFNAKTGRDRLTADLIKPEFKDGQWVTPPRDMKPGEVRAVSGGQQTKDANDALSLIQQAREILPNSTGSYGEMLIDQGARFFGKSTEGAMASAKLKAIGGMLTSKMPKMSGPQSDKDVQMYREMAGRVGDETLPIAERTAALDAVEQIQNRYASGQGGLPASQATSGPKQGDVVDGYVFRGGNPSDPHNWAKVK